MNKSYVYPAIESRGYHISPFWPVWTEQERMERCPTYHGNGIFVEGVVNEVKCKTFNFKVIPMSIQTCIEVKLWGGFDTLSFETDEEYDEYMEREFQIGDNVIVGFGAGGFVRGYICAKTETFDEYFYDVCIHGGDLSNCKYVIGHLSARGDDYEIEIDKDFVEE